MQRFCLGQYNGGRMSIQTQITRLTTIRNTIRSKLVELGLVQSTAKLEDCATALSTIENKGSVQAEIVEGQTYTIPKGFHNGSGTVSATAGGGNYKLQHKEVTPTKAQQTVTPDEGNYGLSDVVVAAIPEIYQDVSDVTLTKDKALEGYIFVDEQGVEQVGGMANNGAISETIDGLVKTSVSIPAGYTSGGTVSLTSDIENALAEI